MLNTDFDGKYLPRTSQQTKEFAKENGWDCFVAGDRELFVDLDTKESIAGFAKLFELLQGLLPDATILKQTTSKSGVGQHVYIRLSAAMAVQERIALQAALGSDGKREMLSLIRAMTNDPEPVLFFETRAITPVHAVSIDFGDDDIPF